MGKEVQKVVERKPIKAAAYIFLIIGTLHHACDIFVIGFGGKSDLFRVGMALFGYIVFFLLYEMWRKDVGFVHVFDDED